MPIENPKMAGLLMASILVLSFGVGIFFMAEMIANFNTRIANLFFGDFKKSICDSDSNNKNTLSWKIILWICRSMGIVIITGSIIMFLMYMFSLD